MRLSRKAGLLACGIRWLKYYCTKDTETTTECYLGAQQQVSSGTDTSGETSFTGLSSYTFDRTAGTVYASGDQMTVNMANPGVVYANNGTDGTSIYGYHVMDNGFYQTFTKTVKYETTTTTTFTRNGLVGTVRAADGEYPDAKKGYSYVTTTDDGCVIMKDSQGVYYAYTPVKVSDNGSSSGGSTDTTDEVVATLEDGVLYIKKAPATLTDGVLEVG